MARQRRKRRYHVSPAVNRDSIRRFGLDWRRMPQSETGIAGGFPGRPEQEGVFLTDGEEIAETSFFVGMGRGREIDVWEVDVAGLELEPGPDGWLLCRTPIDPKRVKRVETWQTEADGFGVGTRVFPPSG